MSPTRRPSCDTCIGACCIAFEEVALTEQDLLRIDAAVGAEHPPWFRHLDPGTSPLHVAVLLRKEQACIFHLDEGCAVYEARPEVCRIFGVDHCEAVYRPDPRKISGLLRLGEDPARRLPSA